VSGKELMPERYGTVAWFSLLQGLLGVFTVQGDLNDQIYLADNRFNHPLIEAEFPLRRQNSITLNFVEKVILSQRLNIPGPQSGEPWLRIPSPVPRRV
jgi:hypothetical protein